MGVAFRPFLKTDFIISSREREVEFSQQKNPNIDVYFKIQEVFLSRPSWFVQIFSTK